MKDLQKWLLNKCNLDYSIDKLRDLTYLSIPDYNLTEIHKDINLLTNLENFTCHHNEIIEITLRLPKLKTFNCCGNKIVKLNLDCPNLVSLYLSGNLLTSIDIDCPKIEILHCNDNKLKDIKSEFPKLRTLSCYDNEFQVIINSNTHKLLDKFKKEYVLIEESKMSEII